MKKRLISLFLALTMTWGLRPAQAVLPPRLHRLPRPRPRWRQRIPGRKTKTRMPAGAQDQGAQDQGAQAGKAAYTLNIGSAMSSTNPSSVALQSFKKAVEERTGGDLAVNIYTDSALGGEADLLEQVTSGTVEGMMQMGAATGSL